MLKKCLLLFFVGFIGFIGFSIAGIISTENNITAGYGDYVYLNKGQCIRLNQNNCLQYGTIQDGDTYLNISTVNYLYCFNTGGSYYNGYNSNTRCTYWIYDLNNYNGNCQNFQECPECESQYTSSECQQEYSLMPISSCDSEFCNMNNLCGTSSGDVTGDGNWSSLYINDIQFPGKAFIDVTIPDYITWDYSSDETGFNLYVGSGYDVDYINSIVDINSYRPDSSDFTGIFVSGLTLVFPYIILALFLAFMRKLLKRIFKH